MALAWDQEKKLYETLDRMAKALDTVVEVMLSHYEAAPNNVPKPTTGEVWTQLPRDYNELASKFLDRGERISWLEGTLVDRGHDYDELKKSHTEVRKERDALMGLQDKLKDDYVDLRKDREFLKDGYKELKGEFDKLSASYKETSKDRDYVMHLNTDLNKKNDDLHEDHKKLKKAYNSLTDEYIDRTKDRDTFAAAHKDLVKANSELRAERAEWVTNNQEMLEKLNTQIVNLRAEIDNRNAQIRRQSEMIGQLHRTMPAGSETIDYDAESYANVIARDKFSYWCETGLSQHGRLSSDKHSMWRDRGRIYYASANGVFQLEALQVNAMPSTARLINT